MDHAGRGSVYNLSGLLHFLHRSCVLIMLFLIVSSTLLASLVLLIDSALSVSEAAGAAVPVYQWHCLVPCLTTRSSVKSLRQSSSLDSGVMSNLHSRLSCHFVCWHSYQ